MAKKNNEQQNIPSTESSEAPAPRTRRAREPGKPRERKFVVKGKGFKEPFDAQWKAETFLAGLTDERLPATIDAPDGSLLAFRQAGQAAPPPVDQTVAPRED